MPFNTAIVGVHPDMAAADYHALPGASASKLRKLWQSTPAHLRAQEDAEDDDSTIQMILGTLTHSVILEPEKSLPGIAISPDWYNPDGGTASGDKKPAGAEWKAWNYNATVCDNWRTKAKADGLLPLKREKYDNVFGMAMAVARHELAGPLLSAGQSEVSLVSHTGGNELFDPEKHVPIRARLDFVPHGADFLADVKSTANVKPRLWQKKAFEDGLHIQAALYLALWNSLTGENRTGFKFIAVEQSPPHDVNVFVCNTEFLNFGRAALAAALGIFTGCTLTNKWPGSPPREVELGIPRYAEERL